MPRVRPKENVRRARSELYRQLVLDAAERVFADKGFEDAKMEEIAAESGLSLGTLYSVFSGKADLFRAVHDARVREVVDLANAAARDARTPLEMLEGAVHAYVRFFTAHPDFLRLHLREGYAWGLLETASPSRERTEAWNEGVALQTALFERGVAEGQFRPGDPRLMARLMIAMHQVYLGHWVEGGMKRDPDELIEEMQAQVRRSFCVDGEARP